MAQINRPTDYFNTKLYSGNGSSTQAVTGVGFKPDWVWIKSRTDAEDHTGYDIVRGSTSRLSPNTTGAEFTDASQGLQSFDSDGFTTGNSDQNNKTGQNYAAWNFLAGGTASSNTDGSITSTVSANTTSGFSIVQWTGTGANGTIGHGIDKPRMIIIKDRDASTDWAIYHGSLGATKFIELNTTLASQTNDTAWNDTEPTSLVFSIGTGGIVNTSSNDYIAYCFAEKKGFSKFGSYTGNGSADGTFIYTGFRPAFVLAKSSTITSEWQMSDDARYPTNPNNAYLAASSNAAEVTGFPTDFLSNGFKIRTTLGGWNSSGATFIYMAFAENPLVGTNNIPACAR